MDSKTNRNGWGWFALKAITLLYLNIIYYTINRINDLKCFSYLGTFHRPASIFLLFSKCKSFKQLTNPSGQLIQLNSADWSTEKNPMPPDSSSLKFKQFIGRCCTWLCIFIFYIYPPVVSLFLFFTFCTFRSTIMHYLQKLIAGAQQHCSTRPRPLGGGQLTTLLTLFAGTLGKWLEMGKGMRKDPQAALWNANEIAF